VNSIPLKTSLLLRILLLISALVLGTSNSATAQTIYPFQSMGPNEDMANGLNRYWTWGEEQLFLTTEEGFHYYDFASEQWVDRTWPDWIDRARYAVVPVPGHQDRLALGGVNASFKGTLWLSEDMGETDDLIYESNGGKVTDMAVTTWEDTLILACTWSDIADGELMRSDDFGESWHLLTGHGHHAMTGVEVLIQDEIYVSGDNYVQRSLDGGGSWESLQANLPSAQGIYCLLVEEPIAALPLPKTSSRIKDDPVIYANFLMVSNDSGVYLSDARDIYWEQVLPFSCRAVAHRFIQLDTFIFWTEWYAVTFDGRLLVTLNGNWDNWIDATDMIAPGIPIDVEANGSRVYVATTASGVFHSNGINGVSPVPPLPADFSLLARPNPFNPRTELNFSVPRAGQAVIDIYDLAGRRIDTVFRGTVEGGEHRVVWQPMGLSSGVYFAVMRMADREVVEQVMLVK